MVTYIEYINSVIDNFQKAKKVALQDCLNSCISPTMPSEDFLDNIKAKGLSNKVLMFSPHPDDESMQALPFRFMKDCNTQIINVAVTLGSDKSRQLERQRELFEASEVSKFKSLILGFENITPHFREISALLWLEKSMTIVDLILEHKPIAIIFPHIDDFNKTHIGTSMLVKDALKIVQDKWQGLSIESEYWQPMKSPNLMIEVDTEILNIQLQSLACHKKEVERNAYHLMLPSYFIDNTRRGCELIGGQGSSTPKDMMFSQLYKVSTFNGQQWIPAFDSKIVSKYESLVQLFDKLSCNF